MKRDRINNNGHRRDREGGGRLPEAWRKPMVLLLCLGTPAVMHMTVELACNKGWNEILLKYVLMNYLIYAVCCGALMLITGSLRLSLIPGELLAFIYGTASHFLLEFKEAPLQPGDLVAVKTGLDVAEGYEYRLTGGIIASGILCAIWILLIVLLVKKTEYRRYKDIRFLLIRVCSILGGCLMLYLPFQYVDVSKMFGVSVYTWRPGDTYSEAGSAVCFLVDAQKMRINKPKGYSPEAAKELINAYEPDVVDQSNRPNVIVIMNEAFCDLKGVGPFESDEYLKNWNSVSDYMAKGWGYVSIYGGGTCDSEFEFLTGTSITLLGTQMHAYQAINFSHSENLVSVFHDLGYKTTAIHPGTATNWNRDSAYKQMGFSEFLSLDNAFEKAEKWRGYVKDSETYDKVIETLESSEEPAFIFDVTIQNHSGFSLDRIKPEDQISIEEKYAGYEDVIGYLSGIKQSDEALGELIEYLRSSDKEVVLCVFGDHLPRVSDEFLKAIAEGNPQDAVQAEADRYKVPYMIWTNYMTPERQQEDMSINYLSAKLLEVLGMRTSYSKALQDVQSRIPRVYIGGYMENGVQHPLSEMNEDVQKLSWMQYYQLFDARE